MIMTHLQPPVSPQSLVLDIFFGCYRTDNGGTNRPWLNDGGAIRYVSCHGQW